MTGDFGIQATAEAPHVESAGHRLAPEPVPAAEDNHNRERSRQLDRVTLRGIRGYGHHGVYAFERERGQSFVVDVSCGLDLGSASRSDDLAETLNYAELTRQVVADIEGEPLNLIEALAHRVAGTCLTWSGVETVEVTVHKPEAPIPADVADVAVTLTRSKTCE